MDFQDNKNLIENKEEKLLETFLQPGRLQQPSRLEKGDELILEVKNLSVSFGDDTVVDNLSFNLKRERMSP